MTRRSWREARRYVIGPLLVGVPMLAARRRAGWLAVGAAGLVASFFRDPDRSVSAEPGVVYAAADGIVTRIDERVDEAWIDGQEAVRISTFLSLHNVHVNRSPVAGEVAKVEAVPGSFTPALFPGAADNSRRRLAIDGEAGRVVVVQVAGLIARKISGWVGIGDRVAAGQRLGIIHFGSRTDVILPRGDVQVLANVGDRTRAGLTPLARYATTTGASCATT